MDLLSIIGIVLSLVAILGGNILEGGHTGSLMQLTAFVIVFGGTLGAVLVQTPMSTSLRSLKMTLWIFLPPRVDAKSAIEKILGWSQIARKEGLLGLESAIETEPDEFSRKGLQLLASRIDATIERPLAEPELAGLSNRRAPALA